MPREIAEKLREWGRDADFDNELLDIYPRIQFLRDMLYEDYEPTKGPQHPTFIDRLTSWVNNVTPDVDQQSLLRLVPKLCFIGPKEFDALLISAFRNSVVQWLVQTHGWALNRVGLSNLLEQAVRGIWFTGLTDSSQLVKFCHLNTIEGIDWRPDWRGLAHGVVDVARIERYMADNALHSIVIVEDFVGTGSQLMESIGPALQLPSQPPVLFCPSIICPMGCTVAEAIAQQYPQFHFSPVLRLDSDSFVHQIAKPNELALMQTIRDLVVKVHGQVAGSGWPQDHGPFGFNFPNFPVMGGLIVMHTNCPDNTLPIIHHNSDGPWSALFPRSSRIV